jgi:hypothetical protein
MWGGAHAKKWGAIDDLVLKDGQSNHIAVFPTKVKGAAAQLDLWRRAYTGMSLSAAVRKWSGGNSSTAYMTFLKKRTGIAQNDQVTDALLAGPKGLALMQAQAQWEAGEPYPMTNAEWEEARKLVFPPKPVPVIAKPKQHPAEMPAAVTVGAAAAASSVQAGLPWWSVVLGVVVAAIAVIAIIRYFHKKG